MSSSSALARAVIRRRTGNGSPPDYADHLRILDKNQQLVPFRPNAAQERYRARRTQRNLILKARQLGMSTVIQADGFLACMTRTTQLATLAHDDVTTQKLRRMTDRFWTHLPPGLRPPRGIDNATTTTYPHTLSEVLIVTAGSANVGRGGTYNRVHGSEVAFWRDAEAIVSGLLQGVTAQGVVELESTPNGAQGWFYERVMAALDGDPAWTLHLFPWWDEPDYRLPLDAPDEVRPDEEEALLMARHGLTPEQIKWRREKRREIGARLFTQEYLEDARAAFLVSGAGFFGALPDVFSAPLDAEPDAAHRYVAGLDWGQAQDYTVLFVWDVTAKRQASLLRLNRLQWHEMRRRVAAECRRWNVRLIVAEKNSAQSNIEDLRQEFARDWRPPAVLEFVTSSTSKPAILSDLYEALSTDGWTLQNLPDVRREFQAFQARQNGGRWTYGAPAGEHDDIVMAAAFGLYGALRAWSDGAQRVPELLEAHFLADA